MNVLCGELRLSSLLSCPFSCLLQLYYCSTAQLGRVQSVAAGEKSLKQEEQHPCEELRSMLLQSILPR